MPDEIDSGIIREISANTVSRYSARFARLGYDVKSLGWGSVEQQRYRFEQTLTFPELFSGRSILDIGCGFGDYLDYLDEGVLPFRDYLGLDINPDLIGEAEKRHAGRANARFEVRNLLAEDAVHTPVADVGVMLGLLNFRLGEGVANLAYSRMVMERAFAMVGEVLVVDFLSARLTSSYPREDFVYYHEPADALGMALELADEVILKHDYLPIPQREFMIFLKKTK
jgi:SAM-dependent methyltransferase